MQSLWGVYETLESAARRVVDERDALRAEVEKLRADSTSGRLFPMIGGGHIPWWLAEVAYRVYAALCGTHQSLDRLAERGGFGWDELGSLLDWNSRRVGSFVMTPKLRVVLRQAWLDIRSVDIDGTGKRGAK